jgi:hypothetical protein
MKLDREMEEKMDMATRLMPMLENNGLTGCKWAKMRNSIIITRFDAYVLPIKITRDSAYFHRSMAFDDIQMVIRKGGEEHSKGTWENTINQMKPEPFYKIKTTDDAMYLSGLRKIREGEASASYDSVRYKIFISKKSAKLTMELVKDGRELKLEPKL